MERAEQAHPAVSLLQLAAAVVVTLTLSLALSGPLVRRPDPAHPPVVVGDIESQVGEDGRSLSVIVELTSSRSGLQRSKTWWILARPGEGRPWEARRAYISSVQASEVPSSESRRLRWQEEVSVPEGVYELWAFTHVEEGDGYVHSDGRVALDPLVPIRAAGPARQAPPPAS